jgi:hypothetical protein
MGQYLPDRLFWAREEDDDDAEAEDSSSSDAAPRSQGH